MSVIFSTDKCCFIDHEQFLEGIYSSCKVLKQHYGVMACSAVVAERIKLKFNPNAFAINLPFIMDSQVHKIIGSISNGEEIINKQVKQKKKRKRQHTNSIVEFHIQIQDFLLTALQELEEIGCQMGLFQSPSLELMASNNQDARNVAKRVQKQSEKFAELFNHERLHPFEMNVISFTDSVTINRLNNSFVNYTGEEPCFASIANNDFVLPANSSFFMSQLEHLPQFLTLGKSYDLIVLDPPWFNKSVKRKKGYSTLSKNDILEIPIERLSKQGCIVAVWVTNSQSLLTFVKEELFPAWKLKFCAIWHWVKVTKTGKLTCDLNSHHKKPYEHIIIGRYWEEGAELNFPNHRVIFSIPSSIHSHKPPLHNILRPYMKDESENLELFSRYLLPGWTSWGNEVLLLQHLDNYKCQDLKHKRTEEEKSIE